MSVNKPRFRNTLLLFLGCFLPASLLIGGLTCWYIEEQKNVVLERYQVEARHHVEGQVERVRRFYKQGIAMLLALARDKAVQSAFTNHAAKSEVTNAFIDIMRASKVYDQIRLLDNSGQEVVRVQQRSDGPHVIPSNQLQDKAKRTYVRQTLALSTGSVYVSALDLNMEHGVIEQPYKAMLRLATPLEDANGQTYGAVIINLRGIGIMQRELPASVLAGEHLFINADSPYWFDRHVNALQVYENEDAISQKHSLSNGWLRNLKGEDGKITNTDGQFTFASIAPESYKLIAGSSPPPTWEIVSFVPSVALNAAIDGAGQFALQAAAVMIILLAIILWFWAGKHVLLRFVVRQQQDLNESGRKLTRRLIEVREEERAELARVLHDDIAQDLLVVQMQIDTVANQCAEQNHTATRLDLQFSQNSIGKLIQRVRGQINQLRPMQLEALGLKATLVVLCNDLVEKNGMHCRIDIDDVVDAWPQAVQLNVYRVVQEALQNIIRHAHATKAAVALTCEAGRAHLFIEDDGAGFDVDTTQHGLGLTGIGERCALLGGGMQVESASGNGTRLHIWFPIDFPGVGEGHA